MAYIGFEDIPARTIRNRIVPALRKYYRADGTYDLFDLYNPQQNCIHYLANKGEVGLFSGRSYSPDQTSESPRPLGEWSIAASTTNSSTFNKTSLYYYEANSAEHRAALSLHYFTLKFDNSVGLYPYIVHAESWARTVGARSNVIYVNRSNTAKEVIAGGNRVASVTWSPEFGIASQMLDWKDYDCFYCGAFGADGTEHAAASSLIELSFIHRFTDSHPLYRYYR